LLRALLDFPNAGFTGVDFAFARSAEENALRIVLHNPNQQATRSSHLIDAAFSTT